MEETKDGDEGFLAEGGWDNIRRVRRVLGEGGDRVGEIGGEDRLVIIAKLGRGDDGVSGEGGGGSCGGVGSTAVGGGVGFTRVTRKDFVAGTAEPERGDVIGASEGGTDLLGRVGGIDVAGEGGARGEADGADGAWLEDTRGSGGRATGGLAGGTAMASTGRAN